MLNSRQGIAIAPMLRFRERHAVFGLQGTDVSSSADTGTNKSKNKVEWKSTADSAPNPASASLSKESIVPQRSQAVDDQPTSNTGGSPDNKGKVLGL